MNDSFKFRLGVDKPRVSGDHRELVSYATFDQASGDVDATVVISSDWGLTIYLTVPASLVRCDSRTLWLLLSDLDATYWMLGHTELAVVSLIRAPVGSELITADGSAAAVIDGVWTDPFFDGAMHDQAEQVVLGRTLRIDLALLRAKRDLEIERRKALRSTGTFALAWDFDISPPRYLFKTFEWYEPGRE